MFCMLFVGLKEDLITRLLEHYQQVGELGENIRR